jgi:hypothetical protein
MPRTNIWFKQTFFIANKAVILEPTAAYGELIVVCDHRATLTCREVFSRKKRESCKVGFRSHGLPIP